MRRATPRLTDKAVIALREVPGLGRAGGAFCGAAGVTRGHAQALAVIEANKQCTVAVLAGGVAFWDCTGRQEARGSPSATRTRSWLRRLRGAALNCGRLAHKGRVLSPVL